MKLQMAAMILLNSNVLLCAAEVRLSRPADIRSGVVQPLGSVSGLYPTPSTFTMSSINPDAGVVVTGTVYWDLAKARPNLDWDLQVSADSGTLTNCPGIPLSALVFSCVSVVPSGTGNPIGRCTSSGAPLTTSARSFAHGNRGGGNSNFTVTITLAFTDSWRFAASQSCSLSLTYTLLYDLPNTYAPLSFSR
jgi:hypothetical protein